jgi:hypothetical protein
MNTLSSESYLDVLGQISLDEMHIQHAFDYYKQRYQRSASAQTFVTTNCSIDDEMKSSLQVGYCDRTIGNHIPRVRTAEGAAIRGSLQRCGLVRGTGHELFRGCVVFPTFDDNGTVISAIGYRIGRIRSGDKAVVYWHKPESKAFVDIGMTFAKELIHGQAFH